MTMLNPITVIYFAALMLGSQTTMLISAIAVHLLNTAF
jgi:hypothetical protein